MHALSGAYAVDALDPDERTRFEAHLRECADCRDEVAGLREASALLGSAEAVEPPASVRDNVLAQIQGVRPLPPETVDSDGDGSRDASRPRSLRSARQRRLLDLRPSSATSSLGRRGLPLLVAAAVVLIAAVGGIWLKPWANDSGDAPAPRLTAAERVLGADDATRVEKSFPDGARATVVVSRSEGRAVILTKDMEHAPEGLDYQLWLQTPAGELEPDRVMPDLRSATVLLEGDASRATGVGITVEPDGGSTQPTSEPIAFFNLGV